MSDLNTKWEQIREFQEKFGQPYRETPMKLDDSRAKIRSSWMLEEVGEFLEADNVIDQSDAMIDLVYFAIGTMVEMGVKPEKIFNEVHKANMSKLWEDGKPRFDEKGKVIKPDNWQTPEPIIEEILKAQKK